MKEFRRMWHNLTLAGAKRVRDQALLQAAQMNLSVSVVIVDRAGVILLLETMDMPLPVLPRLP